MTHSVWREGSGGVEVSTCRGVEGRMARETPFWEGVEVSRCRGVEVSGGTMRVGLHPTG
jgi:hypothetical protein